MARGSGVSALELVAFTRAETVCGKRGMLLAQINVWHMIT
jgi:hypothetical protein